MARLFKIRPRLRRIFARIDPSALSFEDDLEMTEADVGLAGTERSHLAFGLYSRHGFQKALEVYGLLGRLGERDLTQIEVRLEMGDPFRPRFILWSIPDGLAVMDLTLSQTRGAQVGLQGEAGEKALLFVDGILLQHPRRRFEWSRPPLPDQARPGLSLFTEIIEVLALIAKRIGAEGIALVPSSFHAAWIYERYFRFVSGAAQGRFEALRYALALRPLWLLAWAIALGCVRGPDGKPYVYEPAPMLCPLTDTLTHPLETRGYYQALRQHGDTPFEIDWALLRARFPWDLMPSEPPPARIRSLLGTRPAAVQTPALSTEQRGR